MLSDAEFFRIMATPKPNKTLLQIDRRLCNVLMNPIDSVGKVSWKYETREHLEYPWNPMEIQ